ncbi:hypothetical protein CONLIGDRAFT_687186 [Coniochaeta ligniaria NRRL 30616]|uniref:DUF6546 domain-containing protein n=1 Tax=Coniochaeta ligniaria NRRL 30616 TaxID=1408157 RepID=A0A1J7IYU1_9PEZI|nr:hypothetical protein CONLIGDRAFT_687186 [Coniochaeta ligniaria NRRL 30616]
MPPLHWTNLPVELRLLILEDVLEATSTSQENKSLARYAQVSHEWQRFFEQSTFRRLVLSADDLYYFQKIVLRRYQPYQLAGQLESAYRLPIEHIWLRLSLFEYGQAGGHWDCLVPETDVEVAGNDILFTEAIWKLFTVLASLGPPAGRKGLALEFSAHSPSDSRHAFRSWYNFQRDYPHFATLAAQSEYIDTHQFNTRLQGEHAYLARILQLRMYDQRRRDMAQRLVRPLKFNIKGFPKATREASQAPWPALREASIVTEFLIRRQYLRDISTTSMTWLLRSLPSLQTLRRENWRQITTGQCRADDSGYALHANARLYRKKQDESRSFLTTTLPKCLTHLQLYEDFEIQLHGGKNTRRPRPSRIELLPSLAESTPNLQCLAVGFLTDAVDCIGLRQFYLEEGPLPDHATFNFPHMEYLVLTSQEHLNPSQDHGKVNALLRAAAAVALKMPKLKTIELWNCGNGQACLFRYDAADASSDRFCRLTWRSTWGHGQGRDLVIGADVLKAWEGVVRANVSPTCSLEPEPLHFESCPLRLDSPGDEYLRGGDIFQDDYLKLSRYVLHPTSAMQARVGALPTRAKLVWYRS